MTNNKTQSEQIYFRQLPGGGYVAIDVASVRTLLGARKFRGEVVVERRVARERRDGHIPPVVANAEGATIATVFHKLFPVAQSDVVVAMECLTRDRERGPAGSGAAAVSTR